MDTRKKISLNECYNYLKKSYDRLNKQQSSSEQAPKLFPNINHSENAGQSNSSDNTSSDKC